MTKALQMCFLTLMKWSIRENFKIEKLTPDNPNKINKRDLPFPNMPKTKRKSFLPYYNK